MESVECVYSESPNNCVSDCLVSTVGWPVAADVVHPGNSPRSSCPPRKAGDGASQFVFSKGVFEDAQKNKSIEVIVTANRRL
jgi:hypothetical protein